MASGAPFSTSRTSNYIAKQGGLPEFFRKIVRGIREGTPGMSLSHAIRLAYGALRRWAAGLGGVNADTRAKAIAALAELAAKGAKSKAETAAKKLARAA